MILSDEEIKKSLFEAGFYQDRSLEDIPTIDSRIFTFAKIILTKQLKLIVQDLENKNV